MFFPKPQTACQRPLVVRPAAGFILGAALLFLQGDPLGAAVYRWVDENGKVHFGDRPPVTQAEEIEIRGRPSSAPSSVPRPGAESVTDRLQRYRQERADKKKAAMREREERKRRESECHIARDDLKQYETAGRLYDLNPDGTRHYLDDAERAGRMARLKKAIERNCN